MRKTQRFPGQPLRYSLVEGHTLVVGKGDEGLTLPSEESIFDFVGWDRRVGAIRPAGDCHWCVIILVIVTFHQPVKQWIDFPSATREFPGAV